MGITVTISEAGRGAKTWLWISLAAGGLVLLGCDGPEEAQAPPEKPDSAMQVFKKEVEDMETRLDGFQKKLQGVMENLKTPAAPGEEEAAKKPAPPTPSEELQEVMESLKTPVAPGEETAKKPAPPTPGEELQEVMESLKTPVAPGEETAKKPVVSAPAPVGAQDPAPRPRRSVKAEAAPAMPASPKRPRPVFGTVQAQPEPAAKEEEGGKAFDLGLAEWRQNNFSAAIGHFEAAVTAEPNNAHAFWNLAVLLDRQGEGKKAIAAMERAEEIYRAHGQREDVLKAREHLLEWYKKYGGQAGAQAAQG